MQRARGGESRGGLADQTGVGGYAFNEFVAVGYSVSVPTPS